MIVVGVGNAATVNASARPDGLAKVATSFPSVGPAASVTISVTVFVTRREAGACAAKDTRDTIACTKLKRQDAAPTSQRYCI